MHHTEESIWRKVLETIAAALGERGEDVWIVGGCLRDALVGRAVRDVDLVVEGGMDRVDAMLRALPGRFQHGVGRLRHDTVRVVVDSARGLHLDIARMRGASLVDDLAARDFTINAMALPLSEAVDVLAGAACEIGQSAIGDLLIDPLGGFEDLRAHMLRLASPTALIHDPGRILRAARFLAQLDLVPATETEQAAAQTAPWLATLQAERLREELNALFALPELAAGVDWLRTTGALAVLVSSGGGTTDIATHIAARGLDGLARTLTVAAALHPNAVSAPGLMAPLAALPAVREWYARPLPTGYPRFVALAWGIFTHVTSRAAGLGADAPIARLPGGQTRTIAGSIARHMDDASGLLAQEQPGLAAVRRYFALTAGHEELGIDALVAATVCAVAGAEMDAHAPADGATVASRAAEILGAFFADVERYVPPPLLSGADVQGMVPLLAGPRIGHVLRQVRQAQLDGRLATRDDALALARSLVMEDG